MQVLNYQQQFFPLLSGFLAEQQKRLCQTDRSKYSSGVYYCFSLRIVSISFYDINTNLCANGKRKISRENLWYCIYHQSESSRGERTDFCTKMVLWNARWQATSELTLNADSSFRAEMSRLAPRVERRERELHRDGRRDLGPELEPPSYVVFV